MLFPRCCLNNACVCGDHDGWWRSVSRLNFKSSVRNCLSEQKRVTPTSYLICFLYDPACLHPGDKGACVSYRTLVFPIGYLPLRPLRHVWIILLILLLICTNQCVCVLYICTLFSAARGSFLSGAKHEGGGLVHHGASLIPGRAPWRVLWAFEVAKSGM